MNIKILTVCLLCIALASCRKEEFQPEAEGVPIPYVDSAIKTTYNQALNATPYTLFKAAWNRSGMDSIIKARGAQYALTILIPSDAAMTADGLTLDVINRTSPALLDSVLLYHTLTQQVLPVELSNRRDNANVNTLLENPYLRSAPFENGYSFDKYFYRQYLKVQGNDLLINSKKVGNATVTYAKNCTLWPINQVLKKPTKTIYEVLEADGRFTMYMGILNLTDMMWDEATLGIGQLRYYFKDGTTAFGNSNSPSYAIRYTSVFAPTDEAFRKAGFNSIDDLMALNNRNPLPYLDWDTFEIIGSGYATDTLLTMHRWGRLFKKQDAFGYGGDNPDAFYSNDLNNDLLSTYALTTGGYTSTIPILYVPLDFGKDNAGHVTVKTKGSTQQAATITEPDINTLMGPVHVVDRLITPVGFKY